MLHGICKDEQKANGFVDAIQYQQEYCKLFMNYDTNIRKHSHSSKVVKVPTIFRKK